METNQDSEIICDIDSRHYLEREGCNVCDSIASKLYGKDLFELLNEHSRILGRRIKFTLPISDDERSILERFVKSSDFELFEYSYRTYPRPQNQYHIGDCINKPTRFIDKIRERLNLVHPVKLHIDYLYVELSYGILCQKNERYSLPFDVETELDIYMMNKQFPHDSDDFPQYHTGFGHISMSTKSLKHKAIMVRECNHSDNNRLYGLCTPYMPANMMVQYEVMALLHRLVPAINLGIESRVNEIVNNAQATKRRVEELVKNTSLEK